MQDDLTVGSELDILENWEKLKKKIPAWNLK